MAHFQMMSDIRILARYFLVSTRLGLEHVHFPGKLFQNKIRIAAWNTKVISFLRFENLQLYKLRWSIPPTP